MIRLITRSDFLRKRGIGGFVGEILLAGEEADQGSPLFGGLITDGAAEHGIFGFESVEDGALGDWAGDIKLDLAADVGQGSKVLGEDDSDHGSTCASTDNTAGRSRTMGFQLSPPPADAYTWPPVVPK